MGMGATMTAVQGYRMDRRAQAARGAFYGSEDLRALDAEAARRVGSRSMTLAESMAAVDGLDEFTFRRLTAGVPQGWWDAEVAKVSPAPEVSPAPTDPGPPAVDYPTDRAEVVARIKTALQKRSGRSWSVTGGRGTAYGWIAIRAMKKDAADQWGSLTPADQALLSNLLGEPVNENGVSIPSGHAYRREYIDRAEGRAPSVVGTPYWD